MAIKYSIKSSHEDDVVFPTFFSGNTREISRRSQMEKGGPYETRDAVNGKAKYVRPQRAQSKLSFRRGRNYRDSLPAAGDSFVHFSALICGRVFRTVILNGYTLLRITATGY